MTTGTLPERLRQVAVWFNETMIGLHNREVIEEAALRIEALESALAALLKHDYAESCQECAIGQSAAWQAARRLVEGK